MPFKGIENIPAIPVWNEHFFFWVFFYVIQLNRLIKSGTILNRNQLRTCLHHLYPKKKGNLELLQERAKVLVNIGGISNAIDSLIRRFNVACVSLFYGYNNGFWSGQKRGFVPENHVFLRNTRLSRRAHPFVVDLSLDFGHWT